MLYDPKWEVETKADPMDYKTFVGWLEKQPSDKTYCYLNHGACLVADYLSAMGYEYVQVYSCGDFVHRVGRKKVNAVYPTQLDRISIESPHTYGEALERAKSRRFIW